MRRRGLVAALALGGVASAGYLAWTLRGVALDDLAAAASRLRPGPLVLFAVAFAGVMYARAARLAVCIGPIRPTRAREVLPSQMAGYLAGLVLPMQGGELARIVVGSRQLGVPAGTLASSIAIERAVDLLIALATLALAIALLPVPSGTLRGVGMTMAAATVIGCALLAAAIRWPAATLEGLGRVFGVLPAPVSAWAAMQARACVEGLATMARASASGRYAALCVLQSLCWSGCVAASLWAVELAPALATVLLAQSLSTLALALPAAPGYVGTFQIAFHWALSPTGADPATGFVAATLLQLLIVAGALAVSAFVIAPRASRA